MGRVKPQKVGHHGGCADCSKLNMENAWFTRKNT